MVMKWGIAMVFDKPNWILFAADWKDIEKYTWFLQDGAPKIAKVTYKIYNKWLKTMVYGRYNLINNYR
jgi:hypothetical protein